MKSKRRAPTSTRTAEVAKADSRGTGSRGTDARGRTDFAIFQGPTDDGKGARVVRVQLESGTVSTGELRPAREGEPLHDRELVRLRPIHSELPICEVEVLHAPPEIGPDGERGDGGQGARNTGRPDSRPARVSTESYRRNWNTVFARKRSSTLN